MRTSSSSTSSSFFFGFFSSNFFFLFCSQQLGSIAAVAYRWRRSPIGRSGDIKKTEEKRRRRDVADVKPPTHLNWNGRLGAIDPLPRSCKAERKKPKFFFFFFFSFFSFFFCQRGGTFDSTERSDWWPIERQPIRGVLPFHGDDVATMFFLKKKNPKFFFLRQREEQTFHFSTKRSDWWTMERQPISGTHSKTKC